LRNLLESMGENPFFFGPMAVVADLQKSMLERFVIDPAKVMARVLVSTGHGPDILIEQNEWLAIPVSYHLFYNFSYRGDGMD